MLFVQTFTLIIMRSSRAGGEGRWYARPANDIVSLIMIVSNDDQPPHSFRHPTLQWVGVIQSLRAPPSSQEKKSISQITFLAELYSIQPEGSGSAQIQWKCCRKVQRTKCKLLASQGWGRPGQDTAISSCLSWCWVLWDFLTQPGH